MDPSARDGDLDTCFDDTRPTAGTIAAGSTDAADPRQAAPLTAERLRAEQEALAIALHEGPVQDFTMLGIRLQQARARLARGELVETERALSLLQLALADEISKLRRMLNDGRRKVS